MKKPLAASIEQYIASFPKTTQDSLKQLRQLISNAAPKATECIKYAIPTFEYHGNLVHFAAYKNHIGFYPAPSGLKAFQAEINAYPNSKGAVQFPLNKPLPEALIAKIVKFRMTENENSFALKRSKKVCSKGHHFYKSNELTECPICTAQSNPQSEFLLNLSKPAQRALLAKKITSLKILSDYTAKEILDLHGMGTKSLAILQEVLTKEKLKFKND